MDVNYKLRGWMGSNRVSDAEMSKRLDMPYGTFKNKMSGRTEWKLSEVFSILKVTGCTFHEIF